MGWFVLQALLTIATPGVHVEQLQTIEATAIPSTLPTLSLAFMYQSIVPVVTTSLEVSFSVQTPNHFLPF